MKMIEKIERRGKDLVIPIVFRADELVLMLEVSQSTILNIQERFKYSSNQYGGNGIEFAFTSIVEGDFRVLWDVVMVLNPIVMGGTVVDVSNLEYNNEELMQEVAEAMNTYVEEIYRKEDENE